MALPTTGPQTPQGMGMAKAMGGARSNGNAPQPAINMSSMVPSAPFVPNGGLQYTPRPAAQPMIGAGLQAHASGPPNTFQQKSAANPYSYNATTGQTGGEDHNTQEMYQQGQIQRAQGNLAGAVAGYGDQERQKFTQQVGQMLGDQNSIGGLRSGGVEQGIANFGDQYGREIGDYAAQTAVQGQEQGLAANDQIQSITQANAAKKDAKKAALMGAIGSGLGIASSFIPGIG